MAHLIFCTSCPKTTVYVNEILNAIKELQTPHAVECIITTQYLRVTGNIQD